MFFLLRYVRLIAQRSDAPPSFVRAVCAKSRAHCGATCADHQTGFAARITPFICDTFVAEWLRYPHGAGVTGT